MSTASTQRSGEMRYESQQHVSEQRDIGRDLIDYFKEYAREKPEVTALWCFGIGFILGWKLKPW